MSSRLLMLLISLSIASIGSNAQTTLIEEKPILNGKTLYIQSPMASTIRITSSNDQKVSVRANVLINQGLNDDAFSMELEETKEGLLLTTKIKNYNSLPETIQIRYQGQDYFFDTDDWNNEKVKKFIEEKGRGNIEWMSHGVGRNIRLVIEVPAGIMVDVDTKFAMVEVEGFNGPLDISSKHGGVDVSFNEGANNELKLRTNWGEIYTNVDLNLDALSEGYSSEERKNLDTYIANGGGPLMELESEHGNIYLRKKD